MRILVVKLGDLGDFILTTPALAALREAHPTATIDLLGVPAAAPLLANGLVNNHLLLPRGALESALATAPLRPLALAGALRRRAYDAFVLLQHLTTAAGTAKYAALALASGAPRRVGLDNGRGPFLTDRVRDQGFGARHEADYWLAVAARLDADPSPRPTLVPFADADATAAEALLADTPRPIVALHPGSGPYSTARRWPADRFVAVGRALTTQRNASLVVVGNERPVNATVAAATGARDLTGRTSIGTLAALLSRVDLLICNDGGVMHVGVAAGTPIVAIFGLTDPRAWGPYYGDSAHQERAQIVDVPLPCRPCLYRGHDLGWRNGCATRDCLDLISTGMVLAAAERQLDCFRPAVEGLSEWRRQVPTAPRTPRPPARRSASGRG